MTARTYPQSGTALTLAVLTGALITAAVWALGGRMAGFEIGPDRPGMWYEWQLAAPTWLSRATAWGGYALHQVAIWALIWRAQHAGYAYTRELKPLNILAFSATALAIALHYAQSAFFYDGLAQDVPEWTSQWSVILLLLLVILMENRRRGIAFGRQWPGFIREAGDLARRYHGYYFSWAAIYTFWYHPMLSTPGHLVGFFYMFLLLTQSCLFFTRAHLNRWWTVSLELMVLFHGVMVAWMQGSASWAMFAFGLAGIFVVTQAYGLGLSRFARFAIAGFYVAAVVAFYSIAGWDRFPAVLRIFAGYYIALPVLAGLVLLLARVTAMRRAEPSPR